MGAQHGEGTECPGWFTLTWLILGYVPFSSIFLKVEGKLIPNRKTSLISHRLLVRHHILVVLQSYPLT